MHLVVAADEVLLNSVKDIEPHSSTKKLGSPFNFGVHVRLAHRSMTDILGNVVGSHGDDMDRLSRSKFFVALVVGGD